MIRCLKSFLNSLCTDHDKQHFEFAGCFYCVRSIRRQSNGLALSHRETFAGDLHFYFTVSDNYKRIERRGVLAETFAGVECEQSDCAALVLQQYSADD